MSTLIRSTWVLLFITGFLAGCAHPAGTAALVAGGVTLAGAQAPGNEIEQIYYLGIFDPQEQVPQAVYRIRLHGQASAISGVKFASGWAPAAIVDTLNAHIGFDKQGLKVDSADKPASGIPTGRRLIMFGPEGFREAPRDHRLVVVMGTSPEAFFNAIGETLETVTNVQIEQSTGAVAGLLTAEMLRISKERDRLKDVQATLRLNEAKEGAK